MHLFVLDAGSDLAAAAVSRLSAVPLVASPLAAVQTGQTRHQRPVLVAPQEFSAKATQPAELQLGYRGRHVLINTPTHLPSCSLKHNKVMWESLVKYHHIIKCHTLI